MKETPLIFTNIVECPVSGCKRGFYTELVSDCCTYYCPEHHKRFTALFLDQKGKKYRLVTSFEMQKEDK